MKHKTYNIVITGVGGQGIITLAGIIAEAALASGYDAKMSEVHGLAQRGGHIEAHVKFGKKVYSSLVPQRGADLIIALEPLEALMCMWYACARTSVLVNSQKLVPLSIYTDKKQYPEITEIIKKIKLFTCQIFQKDATSEVLKATGSIIPLNIYMLGAAYYENLLPLKKEKLLDSIKNTISPKYFELNKKVFNLSK